MLIAALIMFKNEAVNLPNCLKSLSGVVDFTIGYNDHSTDSSQAIFESFGGLIVGQNAGLRHVNGDERLIRALLLDEARKSGATHYLCIDADEVLSDSLKVVFRLYCSELDYGQKLNITWVNLASKGTSYFGPTSPFPPIYKDFVVRDAPDLNYPVNRWEMHFSRTPTSSNSLQEINIPRESGAVLHSQHLDEATYYLKQAKYKCIELVKNPHSAFQINENASFTLLKSDKILLLPRYYESEHARFDVNQVSRIEIFNEIQELFEEHGIEYFEKLDIWSIEELSESFRQISGRKPRKFQMARLQRRIVLKIRSVIKKIWFNQ